MELVARELNVAQSQRRSFVVDDDSQGRRMAVGGAHDVDGELCRRKALVSQQFFDAPRKSTPRWLAETRRPGDRPAGLFRRRRFTGKRTSRSQPFSQLTDIDDLRAEHVDVSGRPPRAFLNEQLQVVDTVDDRQPRVRKSAIPQARYGFLTK